MPDRKFADSDLSVRGIRPPHILMLFASKPLLNLLNKTLSS